MSAPARPSRREVVALGLGWPFGWLPFFRPKHISLAGAKFRIIRNGRARRRYLLIHGNEETARAVLLRYIQVVEGVAYVAEGHTREVEVEGLKLDPNRMFSRAGAEANLRRLNVNVDEARLAGALDTLDRGRERLVRALTPPAGGLTFALHNNSPSYSVTDEVPISDEASIKEPGNPHAFFLCTDARDFAALKASPYNAVMQKSAPKVDDGSLSRLAAERGFRYVNLEVAAGQTDRQREMAWWVEWNLAG